MQNWVWLKPSGCASLYSRCSSHPPAPSCSSRGRVSFQDEATTLIRLLSRQRDLVRADGGCQQPRAGRLNPLAASPARLCVPFSKRSRFVNRRERGVRSPTGAPFERALPPYRAGQLRSSAAAHHPGRDSVRAVGPAARRCSPRPAAPWQRNGWWHRGPECPSDRGAAVRKAEVTKDATPP